MHANNNCMLSFSLLCRVTQKMQVSNYETFCDTTFLCFQATIRYLIKLIKSVNNYVIFLGQCKNGSVTALCRSSVIIMLMHSSCF